MPVHEYTLKELAAYLGFTTQPSASPPRGSTERADNNNGPTPQSSFVWSQDSLVLTYGLGRAYPARTDTRVTPARMRAPPTAIFGVSRCRKRIAPRMAAKSRVSPPSGERTLASTR